MLALLIFGVVLWSLAHLFKRMQPGPRAAMGDKGRLLATVAIVASVVLMVVGYRGADVVPLWEPPAFLRHVNNLLMLFAFYLYAASGMKTRITGIIRHPQLTAFKTWAIAHLLVNGDLASVILFGGLLAWAVASVIAINRATPRPAPPPPAPLGKEIGAVAGAVVVMGIVGAVHIWLGYNPFR